MHRPKVCYLLERSTTLSARWKSSITLLHSLPQPLVPSALRYKLIQFSSAGSFFDGRISSPVDIFSCQQYQGHLSHMRLPFSWQKISYARSQKVHTYSKYVKPSGLARFFRDYRSLIRQKDGSSPSLGRPWISVPVANNYLPRLEAELRGMIYNSFMAGWHLAPRDHRTEISYGWDRATARCWWRNP